MGRFYTSAGIEDVTLETAGLRRLTWDVFVSHTTDDDELVEDVARCVRSYGLTAWVDSDHLAPDDDGPSMGERIKDVIGRSYCLLAVVTGATSRSWWVPFEIGIASDKNRFLSTYGSPRVDLPSFLEVWPRVENHGELHDWCVQVKAMKSRYAPTSREGIIEIAAAQNASYVSEMRTMASRFPGRR